MILQQKLPGNGSSFIKVFMLHVILPIITGVVKEATWEKPHRKIDCGN